MSLLHQPAPPPSASAPEPVSPARRPVATRRWSARRVLLGLAGLWIVSGVYIVPADQQAVVTRFGRVVEPRMLPGIHYALPWPVDSVTKLKVQQRQRLVVGGDVTDAVLGRLDPLVSQFLTGDQNIIHIRTVVQYSVGVPAEYLFRAQDVPRILTSAVESEMARRVAHRDVDSVLTTERPAIQEEVRSSAQRLVNEYGLGVQIASVNIESVAPPPEAADAFRDVAGARSDAARIVNEAHGYANDLVPKARGEARRLLEEAQAYRESNVNQASGDAARFSQVAAEYARAAEVNGRRLYLETMEEILPRIKKLVVDSRGNLDLTIIRQGAPAGPAAPRR